MSKTKQKIIPNLWFDHGQVEDAAMFYLSAFDNAALTRACNEETVKLDAAK